MTRNEFISNKRLTGATVTLTNGKEYTLVYVTKRNKAFAILYSPEYNSYFWVSCLIIVSIDNDRRVYLQKDVREKIRHLFASSKKGRK